MLRRIGFFLLRFSHRPAFVSGKTPAASVYGPGALFKLSKTLFDLAAEDVSRS